MYGQSIPKGTLVTIRTTNDGEITAALTERHRGTYDAIIDRPNGQYAIIPSYRITTIEVAA